MYGEKTAAISKLKIMTMSNGRTVINDKKHQ
jgi:hypothetical protein